MSTEALRTSAPIAIHGHSARRSPGRVAIYGFLIVGVIVCVVPLMWAVSSSFKSASDIFVYPPQIVPAHPITSNYGDLFTHVSFAHWLWTSIWTTTLATALAVTFSAFGGYAFAMYDFPGKSFLFGVLFSSMMVPFAVIMIPLFVEIVHLGWGNTYLALIVPWVAPAFGVFMMRQFIIQSVPAEIVESGRIDGASEMAIFLRLVVPIIRPALAALAVWQFLNTFNAFLWPLVLLSSTDKFTLPLGLNSLLGTFQREYGLVIAGSVVAAIPALLLFWLLRRQLIEGLTVGSVKG
jgi:multiple sugar transport system permease protein